MTISTEKSALANNVFRSTFNYSHQVLEKSKSKLLTALSDATGSIDLTKKSSLNDIFDSYFIQEKQYIDVAGDIFLYKSKDGKFFVVEAQVDEVGSFFESISKEQYEKLVNGAESNLSVLLRNHYQYGNIIPIGPRDTAILGNSKGDMLYYVYLVLNPQHSNSSAELVN